MTSPTKEYGATMKYHDATNEKYDVTRKLRGGGTLGIYI